MTDLHHPARPQPPAQDYPPVQVGREPLPRPRRGVQLFVALGGVVMVVSAITIGHSMNRLEQRLDTAPSAQVTHPPASAAPSPQERVCDVLEGGYPAVVDAIRESKEFMTTPWSDPGTIRTTNTLVRETDDLANELEGALGTDTPSQLRTATVEYITGLRALSMSNRDHASDEQMNGVGSLYNRSRHGVLLACGMDDR